MRLTTSYDVRHPVVMAWVRFVPGAWLVVLTALLCSIGDWWGRCSSCPPGSSFGSGGAHCKALRTSYAGMHHAGMSEASGWFLPRHRDDGG